jgi:hypothetical protein
MKETVGPVCTCGRDLLRGWWRPIDLMVIFMIFTALVRNIFDIPSCDWRNKQRQFKTTLWCVSTLRHGFLGSPLSWINCKKLRTYNATPSPPNQPPNFNAPGPNP